MCKFQFKSEVKQIGQVFPLILIILFCLFVRCREAGVSHSVHILEQNTEKWITFAEWYNEFEIFITAGCGKNVVKNSAFGKQLMRLIRETKKKKVPA